ncbi:hypothetical protein E1B28_005757 [Marasmius oreades]|uniref:Zn(2)-C6 fungal-type domain-containing protein n=1 Tax=Marasmius oreades TaxID=181124 RepID=A0A9P7S5A7_9AGAR|nr:uncharacterized protein E1B28_005757 [Marasmius oreades]KAG7094956.1 hypothetical protein E1B28_005757 [Marasmius oreades]
MTTEQPKSTTTEQPPYPPPHFAFAGAPYPPPPPGAFPPAFFAYPTPPDAQQADSNGSAGGAPAPPPFQVMYGPPGMVYAFPPPVAPANTPPPGSARPKRKQVKMACTNCAAACKRCDDGRPCERCQKYGIADSCVDGQRKERKKGVKRGPYKRKNKGVDGFDFPPEGTEWTVPPPSAATTAAAMHAVAQFAPPEGFYPIYYPPPGTYPPPDGQTTAEGTPSAHPPPMMPLYISGFPPYPYAPPGAVFIPPPGTNPPPPPNAAATTSATAAPTTVEAGSVPEAEKKMDDVPGGPVVNGDNVDPASTTANGSTKKRKQSNKSVDGKAKKLRASASRDCDDGGLSTDD